MTVAPSGKGTLQVEEAPDRLGQSCVSTASVNPAERSPTTVIDGTAHAKTTEHLEKPHLEPASNNQEASSEELFRVDEGLDSIP